MKHMQDKISEHAFECRVGEELVLLHLENGTYQGLDAVGAVRLLD